MRCLLFLVYPISKKMSRVFLASIESAKKIKETGKLSGTPLNLGRLNNTNFFMLDDITKLNISQEKVSGNIKQKQFDIIKISSIQGRSHIETLFKNEDDSSVKIRYTDKNRISAIRGDRVKPHAHYGCR